MFINRRHSMNHKHSIIFIILILLVTLIVGGCQNQPIPNVWPSPTPTETGPIIPNPVAEQNPDSPQVRQYNNDTTTSLSSVVKKVSPAVVGLSVSYRDESSASSLGTGVIIHHKGYILTNSHVAGGAGSIDVVFEDGSVRQGKVIWNDEALDLAVVEVEGGPHYAATMGTAEELEVGDMVIAIGTPLTLKFQHTVTSGIISAKHRTLGIPSDRGISFMEDLLQTDASINPGNSGGPLIDMNGNIIGINTLKVTQAEGLGFAIPIDICTPIIEHIVRDGSYETPYLGILAIDGEIASYLGEEIAEGVCVQAIDRNSPAYRAGLRKGNCILEINGKKIDTVLAMRREIYSAGVDNTVEMTVKDGRDVTTIRCLLSKKPG